ncbi:hypothetical protein [Streptomyces blattellae]|nr:hypothetical protein [Streptomyces blattellae]
MAADGDTDVIRVVATGDGQRERIAGMSYDELDHLGHLGHRGICASH